MSRGDKYDPSQATKSVNDLRMVGASEELDLNAPLYKELSLLPLPETRYKRL